MENWVSRRGVMSFGLAVVVVLSPILCGESPAAGPRSGATGPGERSSGREAPANPPQYWLGVQCRVVDEALRADLDFQGSHGLVVDEVVPDSPADQAGIEQSDVLLSANGKPLESAKDLVDIVAAAEGRVVKLALVRNGETKTIEVTPAPRPKDLDVVFPPFPLGREPEALRKWIERLQAEPGRSLRFRFFHPGVILPPDVPCHPPLPGDVTVTVVKRGDQPAEVTITRKGEKWKAAENELNKLPDDVRPYAEQMLGRAVGEPGGAVRFFDFVPDRAVPPSAEEVPRETPDAAVERRLDTMSRQVDELRRGIEQLRKSQSSKPAEDEK